MGVSFTRALIAFVLVTAGTVARASDDPGAEPFRLFVEGGGAALGGVGYALAEPGLEWRSQDVTVSVGAPLRVGPTDGGGAGLRERDFDERSEFGALLRNFTYGEEGEALRLVAGASPVFTLGHGTAVNGYRPALDPDHRRAGVQLSLVLGPLELQALAGDVLAQRLYAGRAALHLGPLFGWEDRLTVAASFALDPTAPSGPAKRLDEAGAPIGPTTEESVATAELELVLVRTKPFALAPYVDLAARTGGGLGLHVGSSADLRFGAGQANVLALRAEWRRMEAGYLPSQFDGFYELERHAFPTRAGPSKHEAAEASPEGDGLAAELRLSRGERLAIAARVEGRGHGPISAETGVELRDLAGTSVAVLLARRGAYSALDVLDPDGDVWLLAEARTSVGEHLYLFGTGAQLFHVGEDLQLQPIVEVSVGLGAALGL